MTKASKTLAVGLVLGFAFVGVGCQLDPGPKEIQVVRITTPYDKDLLDICFINNNTGIIIGGFDFSSNRKSVILRTNDGGNTWTIDSLKMKNLKIEGIHASGASVFIMVTDLTSGRLAIYKSGDEGHNWLLFSEEMTYPPQFFDSTSGISLFGQRIVRTSNGGASWDSVYNVNLMAPPFIQLAAQSAFVGAGSFFDNLTAGILLKSIDMGTTWIQLPLDGKGLSNMHFIDSDNGFVFAYSGELFKTTDGGSSFRLVNGNILAANPGCYFTSSTEGFYCSRKSIFWSNDGGRNWKLVFTDEAVSMNNKIVYTTDAFIVGKSGLILRITKR